MQPSKRSPRKAAQPKSRSVVPIPSTIETVKGFPDKLVIFKVPASPFWWVRYHDGKPIKRSTKTESKPEAIRFAKSFYESILVNNALGHSNNSRQKSFMLCAEAVIKEDEEKARRKELAARYVSTQKALINNHIKTFFRNYEIGDVDYSVLDRFKTYLFEQELVSSSVKLHFVSVKKIFGHAQRHGIIKVAPLFPKIKQEDNPRAYFKLHQYVKLRRVARRLAGYVAKVKQSNPLNPKEPPKILRNIVVSRELEWMIGFMVYTFIRPTDLKQMRHKDIQIRQGDDGDYLWMPLPKSKKHDSPITSMPRATYFYRKLVEEALERKSKALGKTASREDILDDYVFYPEHAKRDYAYQQIYRQFDFVLEKAQLKKNDRDEVFAPYSLRHTSIMYRLIYGGEINTTKIAKNARTSTEMLERFYVAQLESTDVTRDLHRRKKGRKQQKLTTFISHDNMPDLNDLIRVGVEKIPEHLRNRPVKIGT